MALFITVQELRHLKYTDLSFFLSSFPRPFFLLLSFAPIPTPLSSLATDMAFYDCWQTRERAERSSEHNSVVWPYCLLTQDFQA